MNATETFTTFPVWTPSERIVCGLVTQEQRAAEDSDTVNARIAAVRELDVRLAEAETDGRPTANMIRRSLARAVASAEHAQTHCTNSGTLRTECTACDHTRQLALLAEQV
jgi:hypothetical protein